MGSYPDIIVTGTETPRVLLAVETKLDPSAGDDAARVLRMYLIKMSCPVGLLVTPDELRVYRNHFTGSGPDAVAEVSRHTGVRLFPGVSKLKPSERGPAFEKLVQVWLEELAQGHLLNSLPADVRRTVQLHVLPALENGTVRASGPRSESRV